MRNRKRGQCTPNENSFVQCLHRVWRSFVDDLSFLRPRHVLKRIPSRNGVKVRCALRRFGGFRSSFSCPFTRLVRLTETNSKPRTRSAPGGNTLCSRARACQLGEGCVIWHGGSEEKTTQYSQSEAACLKPAHISVRSCADARHDSFFQPFQLPQSFLA